MDRFPRNCTSVVVGDKGDLPPGTQAPLTLHSSAHFGGGGGSSDFVFVGGGGSGALAASSAVGRLCFFSQPTLISQANASKAAAISRDNGEVSLLRPKGNGVGSLWRAAALCT